MYQAVLYVHIPKPKLAFYKFVQFHERKNKKKKKATKPKTKRSTPKPNKTLN